jgi:hypothetical protein
MELIQQQVPDIGANIQRGYEFGQNARMNNLKMLAAEQEINQKNQLQSLYKLAATGNPQAAQQLSMVAPQAYEGLQKYQNYKIQRGGQLANSVLAVPEPIRPQRYQEMISEIEKEFGQKPNVPSEYSPEAANYLKSIVAQSRSVEDVAKEQYEAPKFQAELANIKARTGSEYLQQNKTRLETQKLDEEINTLKSERENMEKLGISSPTAYKSYQTNIGQNLADRNKPLSQETAKTLGLAQGGIDILGQIKNDIFDPKTGAFQKAKFGKSAAGAILPNVMASEDAQAFATRRENLSDLIGRMRSGGAINKDEETRFLKLIPRFGDKEETVKYKISQLDKEFSSIQSSIDPYNVRGGNYKQSQAPQMTAPEGTLAKGPDGRIYTKKGGSWIPNM